MKPPSMQGLPRELAAAGYATALILLLLPLSDTLVALLPHSPGDVGWRFAAFGLVSRALVSPLLALFLLLVMATVFGHDRARRLVVVVGLGFSVLLAAALPLFVLDAIQMRAGVIETARRAYDITVAIALAKYFSALAVGWVIVRTARARRQEPRRSAARQSERELLPAFQTRRPSVRVDRNGFPAVGSGPAPGDSPASQPT